MRAPTRQNYMAKRRPTSTNPRSSKGTSSGGDDAFTAAILEFLAWARQRTQLLATALVVAVVAVFATIYLINQRSTRLAQAAAELEAVRSVAAFQAGTEARAEIRAYIERFDGTPYALEAYLVLGELYLEDGQADSAVVALEEIAPAYREPLEVQATFLLATALEEAGRWSDAAALYDELLARAEFNFQAREAAEGLARTHIARGDRQAAIGAYQTILEALPANDPQRGRYEMRLAELEAQSL